MSMQHSDLYRYYDFTYGFVSGIAIGLMTNELNNEKFIHQITTLLKDRVKVVP